MILSVIIIFLIMWFTPVVEAGFWGELGKPACLPGQVIKDCQYVAGVSDNQEINSFYSRYYEAVRPCHVVYPLHASNEQPYFRYRTREVYYLALHQEMCLTWYAMQQPKNHGIWLSQGAPNF